VGLRFEDAVRTRRSFSYAFFFAPPVVAAQKAYFP